MNRSIFIIATIILISCSSKMAEKSVNKPLNKRDTARVSVVYNIDSLWKMDSVFRIIRDTFKLSEIDSTSGQAKMKWMRDTMYYLPWKVDPISKQINWIGITREFVQEINVKPLRTK